jgi:hypothetical protein
VRGNAREKQGAVMIPSNRSLITIESIRRFQRTWKPAKIKAPR